jgi:hypothetical protein
MNQKQLSGEYMIGENEPLVCPKCMKNDLVFKVNQLYKESITIFDKHDPHPELEKLGAHKNESVPLPSPYSHEFTHLFAPPSGKNDFIRALHPDLVTGVLAAAGLFLVYTAYQQLPSALLPVLITLIVALVVYLIFRKTALIRYQEIMSENNEEVVSVEQAISLWMKLYYCSRDGLVFDPESGRNMPLEDMKKYLLRPNRKA